MDGVDHLHDSLALMDDFLLAILSDDSQLALHKDAVVHHGMMMPAQFLTCGEHILDSHQFRASLQIVGQLYAVPALAGANQFCGLHRGCGIVLLSSFFATCHDCCCATNGKDGGNHP